MGDKITTYEMIKGKVVKVKTETDEYEQDKYILTLEAEKDKLAAQIIELEESLVSGTQTIEDQITILNEEIDIIEDQIKEVEKLK